MQSKYCNIILSQQLHNFNSTLPPKKKPNKKRTPLQYKLVIKYLITLKPITSLRLTTQLCDIVECELFHK